MARILDDDLVARLDDVLAEQEGSVPALLPAGVAEADVMRAFAGVYLRPPGEALVWWGRHNGWRDDSAFEVLPGLQGLSVAEAVEAYRVLRGHATRYAEDDDSRGARGNPDIYWQRTWMPIFVTGGMVTIAIDCHETIEGSAKLREVDPSQVGQPVHGRVVSPSLGDFIERATTSLERGEYRYDPERRTWTPMTWSQRPVSSRF